MTALEYLLALAPCYKASAAISALLGIAETQTGEAYGANRSLAVAYLTLHWLAIQSRGQSSAAGQITAESEGDLSRSYAAPSSASSSDSSLRGTSWGLELLRLRKASGMIGMRTRMDLFNGAC